MYTIENEGLDWNNISLAIGSADTRLMGYLQSLEEVPGVLNNASASTQGFSQYLIQTGQAYDLAALSATLFNSAINAGITLLVVLQVKLLSSVWDHFNVTVAETKEKIEGVNTRLSELNAEYETLNAIGKESLSKTEQERLDYLDKRIDKEEELLELLEAKAIQEEIGGKFTDLFDEDSYTRKMFDEIFGKSNPLELIFGGGSDNLGTLKRNTDRSLSSYDKLNEDIKVFEKQMEDNSKGSSEYNHAAQQFEKTQDKLHNDVISDLQDEFLHWKEKKLEYEDAIAQLNKDLQNPNLPSKTRKNAEEKIKKYQSWLNGAETYIEKLSAILDSPQQLVESLASRLSNISSKDLRDNFSEDEISILANLKFSNDSTIEDLKALLKETQDTSDATKPVFDPVLFKETLNQENFSDTREDLLELAKTGKLTAESLEQTKGADTFLEEVSMSAEEAVEQLKNLLFTQEMLTDYNNVLDPLTSSYREFQELGYITQQTLEALPEMITSLESFDLFSQIAGDPDQSAEHIQEAFQKIIKQLLTSEDTVSSILNASRGEILVYIQNLRDMNIQNAEELVNGILTFPEHLKTLDEAEQEYLNYLNNKEGYDAKYINNVSSKNSLLISALGAPYQTDYINWINLLQKKVEAYNTFVNSISNSQIVPSGAPYSVYGLAEQVMKESYGKEPLDLSPKNFGPFGFKKNPNASAYTKEQIDAAQNLLDSRDKSNALKRELALDLSPIDPSFNSYYSPGGGGSRSSGGAPAPTPQVYDWIEKKIAAITKDRKSTRLNSSHT